MARRGKPGLVGTVARTTLIAGTATAAVAGTSAVIGAVTGPSDEDVAAQQQAAATLSADEQVAMQAAAASAASAGFTPEEMAQLKELASMKEQGILTEAEFEEQKAKLMA